MYLGIARNPRVRGRHVLALGDFFIQVPARKVRASAPAIGEKVQAALVLIGTVAGVDDGLGRSSKVGDSLARAHVLGTGDVRNRGEFGVGEEGRVVGGTGAVVAAIVGSEGEDADDLSFAAVVAGLVKLTGLLGLLHKGPTLHRFAALDRHEPEGWPWWRRWRKCQSG
jgi:hypothetical protein